MKISRGIGVLPNLITIGNGICGFAAVVRLMKVQPGVDGFSELDLHLFTGAAWLVMLGMLFDVFDGRVARLSGTTSSIGAQLDSLCDLVTFGLAPALMVVRLNMIEPPQWQYLVWFFCLAYFLGAMLRLARFNDENEHDEAAHLCFKGLPSPAAAGCMASLVLFFSYATLGEQRELKALAPWVPASTVRELVSWVPTVLPLVALVLGWTMVTTRLNYDHVASRFFHRKQSFEFVVYLVFGGLLLAMFPEVSLPAIFVGYLLFTPAQHVWRWFKGARPSDAGELENDDESEFSALSGQGTGSADSGRPS
jgi:CDP-diacylglycerol--serine O-phosphatidyltransferase